MAAGGSRLVPRPGQQPQRERLRRAMGQVGPRRPAACGGEGQGCGRGGRGGPGAAQAAAGRGWGCRRRRRGRDGRGACRAERRASAGAGAAVAGAQLRAALLWAGHKRPCVRSATKRHTAAASLQDAIFALRASALKSSYRRACDPWAPQACIFACIAQALFVALPGQQPLDQLPHSGQDSLSGRPRIHVRPVHGTRRRMPAPRAGARGAAARLCARDDQLARHVRGGRAQLGRGRPAAPRVC